jgi:hypothetical protein
MYCIKIFEWKNNGRYDSDRQLLLKQPLNSQQEVDTLRNRLIFEAETHRKAFYFPYLEQAMKVESLFKKFLAVIAAVAADLITLPYRLINQEGYRNELKSTLPIYQYLRSQGVNNAALNDNNDFEVIFYTGEEEPFPLRQVGPFELKYVEPSTLPKTQIFAGYIFNVDKGVTGQRTSSYDLTPADQFELSQKFVKS